MECLTSVLRKDANRAAEGIGTTGSFYPIGLKLWKSGFIYLFIVSHLKMRELFEQPQLKGNDKIFLRQYKELFKWSVIIPSYIQWDNTKLSNPRTF